MTGDTMSLMGCGRTDAGVHAMQYFAHFDFEKEFDFDPVERLNRMLPDDIAIHEIIEVHKSAHSRYDATSRSYEYHIHLDKNPYLSIFSSYVEPKDFDIDLMKDGLNFLTQLEDFRHLCLTPDRFKNTICRMSSAEIIRSDDGKRILFRFTANRFLKSMIRIMVARLLALGEGKLSWHVFKDVNTSNQKLPFKTLAYPQGLHLSKIVYPYLERDVKANFLLRI
jgi:tRNA pseudouridine38-40 synthase